MHDESLKVTRSGRLQVLFETLSEIGGAFGDTSCVESQSGMLVLRVFEEDQRLPITERLEAEGRIADGDSVSCLDQRVRMDVRDYRAAATDDLPEQTLAVLRIQRVGFDDDTRAGHGSHAFQQERHGSRVRAKSPRSDDDVRVPIDLTAIQEKKRAVVAEQALPDLRCAAPSSARPSWLCASCSPSRNRSALAGSAGSGRVEVAIQQIRRRRGQSPAIEEDRARYPPNLAREEQLPTSSQAAEIGAIG